MEPDVRKFLITILQTMSAVLLWLLVNVTAGLKLGILFVEDKFTIWHAVFYLWLLGTFFLLVKYVRKKWKEMPVIDPESDAD